MKKVYDLRVPVEKRKQDGEVTYTILMEKKDIPVVPNKPKWQLDTDKAWLNMKEPDPSKYRQPTIFEKGYDIEDLFDAHSGIWSYKYLVNLKILMFILFLLFCHIVIYKLFSKIVEDYYKSTLAFSLCIHLTLVLLLMFFVLVSGEYIRQDTDYTIPVNYAFFNNISERELVETTRKYWDYTKYEFDVDDPIYNKRKFTIDEDESRLLLEDIIRIERDFYESRIRYNVDQKIYKYLKSSSVYSKCGDFRTCFSNKKYFINSEDYMTVNKEMFHRIYDFQKHYFPSISQKYLCTRSYGPYREYLFNTLFRLFEEQRNVYSTLYYKMYYFEFTQTSTFIDLHHSKWNRTGRELTAYMIHLEKYLKYLNSAIVLPLIEEMTYVRNDNVSLLGVEFPYFKNGYEGSLVKSFLKFRCNYIELIFSSNSYMGCYCNTLLHSLVFNMTFLHDFYMGYYYYYQDYLKERDDYSMIIYNVMMKNYKWHFPKFFAEWESLCKRRQSPLVGHYLQGNLQPFLVRHLLQCPAFMDYVMHQDMLHIKLYMAYAERLMWLFFAYYDRCMDQILGTISSNGWTKEEYIANLLNESLSLTWDYFEEIGRKDILENLSPEDYARMGPTDVRLYFLRELRAIMYYRLEGTGIEKLYMQDMKDYEDLTLEYVINYMHIYYNKKL